MNSWRFFLSGLLVALLSACALPQGGVSTPVASPAKASSAVAGASVFDVPELPCAVVDKADGITIRYEAESLYRGGAVLPREEGLACLNVLTDWLKSVPQSRWQITLAGEEGLGFDALALAGKRQELLQRFFARRGLEIQTSAWLTTAEQGSQMSLRLLAN